MSSSDLIDVTAQPAIASWPHTSGAPRSLDGLRFHIYHDPSTNTAFFKLRATLTFKATGVKPKRTTAAWLHIAPERVETVTLEDEKNVDESVSKKLGANTVCWHFVLNRPGTLVLPPDYDLNSKGQQPDDCLDGLWALAQSTSFSISACLPARTVSRERLLSFCKAANLTASTTAEAASANVKLSSNKHAADTASLYGGKGGQVVELDSLALQDPTGNGTSPPPYTDIGPSPPFVTDTPTGKKRRRRSSSEASATQYRQDDSRDSKAIEDRKAFAKALKDDFKAELKAELMSELRADMKAELKDELKRELFSEVMPEIERRILDRVEERLQEQADDFEKQLYELRYEVGATVYSEVEDQTYTARKELEDFVQEEMEEAQKRVEERIVDRLESANMNIRFNDR